MDDKWDFYTEKIVSPEYIVKWKAEGNTGWHNTCL